MNEGVKESHILIFNQQELANCDFTKLNPKRRSPSYLSSGFSLSVTDVVAAGRLSPDAPGADNKAAAAFGALQLKKQNKNKKNAH